MSPVALFTGVKIEKTGDWFYLRYAELGVRWDHESSWFLTVDDALTHGSSESIEGLCGNHNGDPYGTYSQINSTLTYKVKFSHTRYRALGPELIPVYRQSARR